MLSKNVDMQRSTCLKDRFRDGSLPLKKRRYRPVKDDDFLCEGSLPSNALVSSLLTPKLNCSLPPIFEMPSGRWNSSSKVTSLRLIANQDSAETQSTVSKRQSCRPTSALIETTNDVSVLDKIADENGGSNEETRLSEEEVNNESMASLLPQSGETVFESAALSPMQDCKLLVPNPGGCRGKSFRYNSYCRRLPCYKGSHYCKMHYRQCVMPGIGSADSTDDASTSSSLPERETPSFTSPVSKTLPLSKRKLVTVTSENPQQQDRRYMGHANETRCSATTTRGRACAYVAVQGTKYCNLHGDYDVNPPPRRGGCNNYKPMASSFKEQQTAALTSESMEGRKLMKKTTVHLRLAKTDLATLEASTPVVASSSPTTVSDASDTFRVSPTTVQHELANFPKKTATARRTSAKLKEMHAESPYPLLSMISTDQWSQKQVRIATGPFEGRIGEVQKWGNGWVSVEIPGVGMHNRRSFELYLHAENGDSHESIPVYSELDEPQVCQGEYTDGIVRNISRDSPSSLDEVTIPRESNSGQEFSSAGAVLVTPRPKKPSISMASAFDKDVSSPLRFHKMISNIGRIPDPETPKSDATLAMAVTPSLSQVKTSCNATSVPLMESLLLSPAQDGAKNYKLDLLLGNAALERLRKPVHKTSSYGRTASLINRKRTLSCSEDDAENSERNVRTKV